MSDLTRLERAVLLAIAAQLPESPALTHQIGIAQTIERENTGAGFFTTLSVGTDQRVLEVKSPVGDVRMAIAGLKRGMGFLLWLQDGFIYKLDGYAHADECTFNIDFDCVNFSNLELNKL